MSVSLLCICSLYKCGEVCSHAAAFLFNVEACTLLEISKLTCTTLPCTWNQVFSERYAIIIVMIIIIIIIFVD